MKKSVLMFAVLLTAICAAGMLGASAAEGPLKITGIVVIVDPDLGNMTVQEDSGALVPLIAGPRVDLRSCKEGDLVTLECNIHGIALSLTTAVDR